MSDKLARYHAKRNFSRTSEPSGVGGSGSDAPSYVMHMHAASHDHFDLRLEQDGVLRSWALPKGPSLAQGEKRLAVAVEDHPLDYVAFEGVIPANEYGGGTVLLWDRGWWSPLGSPRKDRLDFELHGKKLSGKWTLVRMRGRKPADRRSVNNWLLIKRSAPVKSLPDDRSVATGRTLDEIAAGKPARDYRSLPDAKRLEGSRERPLPRQVNPQLATLVDQPPDGDQWIHELKFDGYRLTAIIDHCDVTLLTRNGKDWSRSFPKLRRTLSAMVPGTAVLDGELVAMASDGSTSFRRLQERLSAKGRNSGTDELVYQVFDLIYLEGYDLQQTPLLIRKRTLSELIGNADPTGWQVRYSDHVEGQGPAFYEQVCEMGLEGMIAKRADSTYRPGRVKTWLKVKCTRQDEFVVCGFTRPSGARSGFGSLLLGTYEGEELVYAGRVGSGFSFATLARLHRQLTGRTRKTSPFDGPVPDAGGVQWVTPNIVVDVEFTERTDTGALRHPVFRGVREDKPASEVKTAGAAPERSVKARQRTTVSQADTVVAGVSITHPDRILYPDTGVTKLDLARYYEAVHQHMLPHLGGRPLSLLRCPEGLEGECFFQKHPEASFASDVPRTRVAEKNPRRASYLYVSSAADLVQLVQFGVVEFHPWGSRIEDTERPDTLVFDLDPGPDLPWRAVARAANTLRERLLSLGLPSFLQASGGKGLHLVVPIRPHWGWEQVKEFCHGIARAHAADDPAAFTTTMAKNRRRGKVFIDYLRNGRGNTSIGLYSARARPGAPVSTPLRWNELSPGATANRYTVTNLRRRLAALRSDPWEGYEEARVSLSQALMKQFAGG